MAAPVSRTGATDREVEAHQLGSPTYDELINLQYELAGISDWIDQHNAHRDLETNLWSRVTKVSEEAGEAQAALRGLVGENPRKGVTHTREDVVGELLDTAIAALGAVEHLTGNRGDALGLLVAKVDRVHTRAQQVDPPAALLAEQPGGRRLCDDRGPRIGGEGCPRCRLQIGHTGSHRPFPEDGWGDISW